MNPVTPLRRSERLRRPTNQAFGSSPGSSPGTAANVGRSSSSRSRVFSTPGGQTGSDSTLRNTTPSESSGSYMEDANSDSTVSMAMAARFPKELHRAYLGLDRILSYTDDDLMMHDIYGLNGYIKDITALLRGVMGLGCSGQWPHYNYFAKICLRIKEIMDAKRAALPLKMQKEVELGLERMGNYNPFPLGPDLVAMKGEQWQETWKDSDSGYIQSMYRNAAHASNFSLDDVGASGSEEKLAESSALDYSLSYPRARTLDYHTIPDTY